MTSEVFERNEALRAIFPLDGQFGSNLLDVRRSHTSSVKDAFKQVDQIDEGGDFFEAKNKDSLI